MFSCSFSKSVLIDHRQRREQVELTNDFITIFTVLRRMRRKIRKVSSPRNSRIYLVDARTPSRGRTGRRRIFIIILVSRRVSTLLVFLVEFDFKDFVEMIWVELWFYFVRVFPCSNLSLDFFSVEVSFTFCFGLKNNFNFSHVNKNNATHTHQQQQQQQHRKIFTLFVSKGKSYELHLNDNLRYFLEDLLSSQLDPSRLFQDKWSCSSLATPSDELRMWKMSRRRKGEFHTWFHRLQLHSTQEKVSLVSNSAFSRWN